MRNDDDPKSLKEVWEWKEKAWSKVAHLPLREAIKKRLDDSYEAAKRLKIPMVTK